MISHLKSYLHGEAWPPSPGPAGSQMLALMFQFEKSQYLPADQLVDMQFMQLNKIFRHAISTVPYYKRELKAAGFRKLRGITSEQWKDAPILTRTMVQHNRDELLSRRIPREHGRINEIETSGSTGMPIRVSGTDITQFFGQQIACQQRQLCNLPVLLNYIR